MNNIQIQKENQNKNFNMNDQYKIKSNSNINIEKGNLMDNNSYNNRKPNFNQDQSNNNNLKPKMSVDLDGLDLLVNPKKKSNTNSSDSGSMNGSDNRSDNRSSNFMEDDNVFFGKNSDEEESVSLDSDDDESTDSGFESGSGSGSGSVSGSGRKKGMGFGNLFGNNNSDSGSESDSDDSGSTISMSETSAPRREKTYEEIQLEKQEFIRRLERLEKAGYQPSKRYTMQSEYNDIKFEYEKLKAMKDVDSSIKFSRKILMGVASGAEFLNKRFDYFGLRLDGWSESVMENIGDYDEVFEELHEKYKEKVKMSPEIKLLAMVGGSAFMFHLTSTLFKSSIPNVQDMMRQNPDFAKAYQEQTLNNMRSNLGNTPGADTFMNMMNQGVNMQNQKRQQNSNMNSGGQKMNEMKGPSGVDDILNSLNINLQGNDDVSELSNESEGTKQRRIKVRKPKKPFEINL
jgi:DNA-binding Lrp family transcriptional regulator